MVSNQKVSWKPSGSQERPRRYNMEWFKSINEFVSINSGRENNYYSCSRGDEVENNIPSRTEFYGVQSFDEACSLLENGWSEKTSEVLEIVNKNKSINSVKRNRFYNSVVGYVPNVPLAIMGVPQNMINRESTFLKGKVVNLIYMMSIIYSEKNEDILANGKKIITLIQSLENAGYRVSLKVMFGFGTGDKQPAELCMITLKDANQPLDVNRIMFPLIHTAMFRVFGFSWAERRPANECSKLGFSKGICIEYTDFFKGHRGADLALMFQDLIKKLTNEGNNTFISYYMADRSTVKELYDTVVETAKNFKA